MKKSRIMIPIIILLALILAPTFGNNGRALSVLPLNVSAAENDVIPNDKTGIPDKVLYQCILEKLNKNEDETFTKEEAAGVRILLVPNFYYTGETRYSFKYHYVKSLKGIEYLTNLRTLDISGHGLTSLKGLNKLTTLVKLNVSENKLTSLEGIEKSTNLKELDAYDNQLTNLKGIGNLKKLKTLIVYRNKLTNLKEVKNLTRLEQLWANDNRLTDISALKNVKKLRDLRVEENKLKSLKGIENLTGLWFLNASNNKLKSLPNLSKLTNLSLESVNFKANNLKKQDYKASLPAMYQEKNLWPKWLKNELKFQCINRILEVTKPKKVTYKTKTISGKTHAKAWVRILGPNNKKLAEVKADSKGNFTFKDLNLKELGGKKIIIQSYLRDNFESRIFFGETVKKITITVSK